MSNVSHNFHNGPHKECLQAYYAKYNEQVEMNEMRYAKGNAKDYAQHSHPIQAPSAGVWNNVRMPSLFLADSIGKSRLSLSIFVIVHNSSGAGKPRLLVAKLRTFHS